MRFNLVGCTCTLYMSNSLGFGPNSVWYDDVSIFKWFIMC